MMQVPSQLEEAIAQLDKTSGGPLYLLDHAGVDWHGVQRTAYLVHQHFGYAYPSPIRNLEHRLVIIPPETFGDQRRIVHLVDIGGADAGMRETRDAFGNVVIEVRADTVESGINFEAWIVLERSTLDAPHYVPDTWLTDPRMLTPTPLTMPDSDINDTAATLAANGETGLPLARRVSAWVYRHMTYAHGDTDVHTAAADVMRLRRGVCQDYAHLMLALCRSLGLPSRYVSGHLLGEGGSHAWVEVLVPAPERPHSAIAWPFDTTHNCEWGLNYLTIAVGRDYQDVAPTSGTFWGPHVGTMSATKRIGLTAIDYVSGG